MYVPRVHGKSICGEVAGTGSVYADLPDPQPTAAGSNTETGKCFIATATYGSPHTPHRPSSPHGRTALSYEPHTIDKKSELRGSHTRYLGIRADTMRIKLNHSIFKMIGITSSAVLLVGAFLDAVSNSVSIISARATYVLTAAIAIAVIVAHVWLRKHPLIVSSDNGKEERYQGLNLKAFAVILGIITILWIPRLINTGLTSNYDNSVKEVTSNPQESLKAAPTPTPNNLVINGAWDKKQAEKIVFELLNKRGGLAEYGFECVYSDNCLISHGIIDFYNLLYTDKSIIVAAAYSKPKDGFDCHACMPVLSFVEFSRESGGWSLGSVNLKAIENGSWGEPPLSIKVLAIGHNIFGVVIEHGYTAQGHLEGYTTIYSSVAGEFREVFSDTTEVNDSATGNPSTDVWKAKITFRQQGTSFYDLILSKEGVADGKPLKEEVVYKFDGRKYSTSDTYQ